MIIITYSMSLSRLAIPRTFVVVVVVVILVHYYYDPMATYTTPTSSSYCTITNLISYSDINIYIYIYFR